MWLWLWHGKPLSAGTSPETVPEGDAASTAVPPHLPQRKQNTIGFALIGLLIFGGLFVARPQFEEFIRPEQTLSCEGTKEAAGATATLIISTGWFTKQQIRVRLNNTDYTFDITETSPTHYLAMQGVSSIGASLNIDRISGQMRWQWTSFQKGPPPNKDDGLGCFLHGISEEYCESYVNGTYTRVERIYTCRPAVAKF